MAEPTVNPCLEAALEYVRAGFSVIPIGSDKKPLIEWLKNADEKATTADVRRWFAIWPDANVGIVTGEVSGIAVVDVEKGGDASWLPPTAVAKTGGGGWHYYYRYPAGGVGNKTKILELTDIRGHHGYVVAPPSLHASGTRYEWQSRQELAEFPPSLLAKAKADKPSVDWKEVMEGVSEGSRNATAAQVCGKLMRMFAPAEWETAVWPLLQAWDERNAPPMGERELRATYNSIGKRAVNDVRVHEPTAVSAQPVSDVGSVTWTEALEMGQRELQELKPQDCMSFGYNFLDRAMTGIFPADLIVLGASSGCHAKGQEILLHSGEVKNVEDVAVGDLLMGPDSAPRAVQRLIRGTGSMFRIVPIKGDPFVVNGDHVLHLVNTVAEDSRRPRSINITVLDWVKSDQRFKWHYKLTKTGVDFPPSPERLPLDPYFLGVWLGDGDSVGPNINKGDPELIEWVKGYCADNGYGLSIRYYRSKTCPKIRLTSRKGRKADLVEKMRELNLLGNKHIPHCYLVADREDRLKLLAGLIDTDGHYDRGCFEFSSNKERLAQQVAFLARSLGLRATLKVKNQRLSYGDRRVYRSWRIHLSGDLSVVPTLIARKMASARRQVKNCLRSGFTVEPVGSGGYYGFTLSGDGLYVMGDFTVTHNSGKSTIVNNIARKAAAAGHQVFGYALEDRLEDYAIRAIWNRINAYAMEESGREALEYPWNFYRRNAYKDDRKYVERVARAKAELGSDNVRYAVVRGRLDSASLIRSLRQQHERGVRIAWVDHLHYFDLDSHKDLNRTNYIENMMVELRQFQVETGMRIILICHYRKLNGMIPTLESFKDSAAIAQNASYTVNVWRDRGEAVQQEGKKKSAPVLPKMQNGRFVDTHFLIPKARNPNGEAHIVVPFDRFKGDYVDVSPEVMPIFAPPTVKSDDAISPDAFDWG